MSEKITFKELVELIAEQSKQSQSSTNSFISELVQVIEGGLKKNGSVSISGFGKFELRWMNERPGVNPQTGETITIPGQNKIVFKPYKSLREDVNRPYAKMKAQVLESGSSKKSTDEKDEPVPKEPEVKKSITLSTSGSTSEKESEDDESDLIFERPVPKKTVELDAEAENIFGFETEKDETIPEKPTEKKELAKTIPVYPQRTELSKIDESKLAEEVQKSGSMNWSYAAAAVIVALMIIVIMYMMQDYSEPDDVIAETQTEQLAEPTIDAVEEAQEAEETSPEPDITDTQSDTNQNFVLDVHQIEDGESLWTIAETKMGNPYLWPLIYDMNREIIDNPNIIPSDAEIKVPVISDPENLTNSQLEQVAKGYYSVYEWALEEQPDQARYFLWAVGVFSPEKLSRAQSVVNTTDWAFAKFR